MGHRSIKEPARQFARIAREGFAASGRYVRALPESAWGDPTGCAKWDMRTLAGHIVGEAIWFPNVVRGVTQGEVPYPGQLYEDLKNLPKDEMAARTEAAALEIESSISEADDRQLLEPVDLGFTTMPLGAAVSISALEAVLHNWDLRAKREERPTVPTPWAQTIADVITEHAPMLAHRRGVEGFPGTYLLLVEDGVGPVTVTANEGTATVERGETEHPDVTLHLSADQYVRLLAGRLDLASAEGQNVSIQGDRSRAEGLNRIFAGIANG